MSNPSTDGGRLFRDEAVDNQRTQLLGQIILTPRMPVMWLSLFAAFMALALVAFLVLGSHTRRVTVNGQLLPVSGLIRVHTPQVGVVLEKRVTEGQVVAKGDLLYVLSSDRVGDGARELQADIARQLEQRKLSLSQEIERSTLVQAQELESLERRASSLRAEAQAIAAQIEQQKTRLNLAQDTYQRYKGLAEKDYIAQEELLGKEIDLTEQRSRLRGLEREALGVGREIGLVRQEIENTRLRSANLVAQLEREVSATDQQLTEVEARRRVLITAPEAGRATLVAAEVGQMVSENQALVTLIPDTGELYARLYAPSSSIGFVQAGDMVLLRYQAFPYQKFGQHEGVVSSLSTSAVNPAELTGLPTTGLEPGEPVFAIEVKLQSGAIVANGQPRPLQAGMQLEADILQERRKIYEWILEPVYSVTQRLEQ